MKYYGWFHAMEDPQTRHILKNNYDPRWIHYIGSILIQCENVDNMYIMDYNSFTFEESRQHCESVGLELINEFDFFKFPGSIYKIRPYKNSLEYFHEARKNHQLRKKMVQEHIFCKQD